MPVGPGSVWVFDENVIGAALTPLEGQPPLVVYSQMPGTVVFLQVVAWRSPHETHRGRRVELCQFALSYALDVDEPATLAGGKQALRVGAGERLDRHKGILTVNRLTVNSTKVNAWRKDAPATRRYPCSVDCPEPAVRERQVVADCGCSGAGGLLQKFSARQTCGSGIEGHEARAAKVRRPGCEETVGEVRGRKLVEQVERLFHRGVMF